MEKRFVKINADRNLRSSDARVFAAAAAEHAAEINAIHPFLEGNGRLMRLFIEGHAFAAGFTFSSEKIDRKVSYDAAASSFTAGDFRPLAKLIAAHLTLHPPSRRRARLTSPRPRRP
jgi:cell filamentation protein